MTIKDDAKALVEARKEFTKRVAKERKEFLQPFIDRLGASVRDEHSKGASISTIAEQMGTKNRNLVYSFIKGARKKVTVQRFNRKGDVVSLKLPNGDVLSLDTSTGLVDMPDSWADDPQPQHRELMKELRDYAAGEQDT